MVRKANLLDHLLEKYEITRLEAKQVRKIMEIN